MKNKKNNNSISLKKILIVFLMTMASGAIFVFNYSPTLNIFDNEEIVPDGMVKFLGNTKVNEAYIGLRNL